jgi:hypothetical protein
LDTVPKEEMEEVKEKLDSLSDQQKLALIEKSDELKPKAQNMSKEEIGATFIEILNEIISGSANNNSNSILDTYG